MTKHKHQQSDKSAMVDTDGHGVEPSPPMVEDAREEADVVAEPDTTALPAEVPEAVLATEQPGAQELAQDHGPATPGSRPAVVETVLQQELETLRRDLKEAADRHLRLAAEFDNYRKRVERERVELWSRAQGEIAARLLDTLDDLERVAHHTESATAQALHEGVQLIERKLRGALAAAGLEEVEAEKASFDPQVMEAVAVLPTESPEDDDVVSDVFQRGYRFKGQLLRAARVRVKKHE